jgi:hypothetical protein
VDKSGELPMLRGMKQDIESRLQVLFLLSGVFSSSLYGIGIISGYSEGRALVTSLQSGLVLIFYVVDYFIFHVDKNTYSNRGLKLVGDWFLVSILTFILSIGGIIYLILPNAPSWTLHIALYATLTMVLAVVVFPFIMELLLIFAPKKK